MRWLAACIFIIFMSGCGGGGTPTPSSPVGTVMGLCDLQTAASLVAVCIEYASDTVANDNDCGITDVTRYTSEGVVGGSYFGITSQAPGIISLTCEAFAAYVGTCLIPSSAPYTQAVYYMSGFWTSSTAQTDCAGLSGTFQSN